MTWSEELRQAHLDLSPEDLAFRERARQDPEMLRRSTFAALDEERSLLRYSQQPWPILIGKPKLAEMQRASAGVANLIRSIPRRLFGRDSQRLSDFYRIGGAQLADLVMMEPNGIDAVVGRGDFIQTRDGFKCLEFNFAANIGGWRTGILAELHRTIPATAACLAEVAGPYAYTDTPRAFLRYLIADARAKKLLQGGELVLYITLQDDSYRQSWLAFLDYLNGELAAVCREEGLTGRVLAGAYSDLTRLGAGVAYGPHRVHTILEMAYEATTPLAFRAFKAGTASVFDGPAGAILGNKKNLALLSESADAEIWSAEEREIIHRHVPWTRQVHAGTVRFDGREVELAELLRAERPRFVLKEGSSWAGKGVVIGRDADDALWQEAIDTALASGNWVVQEYLDSLPYLFQRGEEGCGPHTVIWGTFLFGQTYGGLFLRLQPQEEKGPVNLSLYASATEGVVLEV